jgi:hypothetical protein
MSIIIVVFGQETLDLKKNAFSLEKKCFPEILVFFLYIGLAFTFSGQGRLTEGEGSVQLTSSLG